LGRKTAIFILLLLTTVILLILFCSSGLFSLDSDDTKPKFDDIKENAIVVPDDYPTIVDAVENASEGEVICVKSGIYNETLLVEKQISLIGEDPETTVIKGSKSGPVIVIRQDSVEISGFTVTNGYWYGMGYSEVRHNTGLHLLHANNCSVTSNKFVKGGCAVWLYDASNNRVTGNTFSDYVIGIKVQSSEKNVVCDNTIIGKKGSLLARTGISVESSSENTICDNTVSDGDNGITVSSSSNNLLEDNVLRNNEHNFGVSGSEPLHFANDVDASNIVNGKPIIYWINEHDQTVPLDAGLVILINCTEITAQKLSVSETGIGMHLVYCKNSNVTGNTVSGSKSAILLKNSQYINVQNNAMSVSLDSSSFNNITDNTGKISLEISTHNVIAKNSITSNGDGITLEESSFNEIAQNNINNNTGDGISMLNSDKNNIYKNNITNNQGGGIWFLYTSQNSISDNNITGNHGVGIYLLGDNHVITENTITQNSLGIYIHEYSNNDITENVITHNEYYGIEIQHSDSNKVSKNYIAYNQIGVLFDYDTDKNKITDNLIEENTECGIQMQKHTGQDNLIFNNNFINNTKQVNIFVDTTGKYGTIVNTWDNGNRGNYWSNYNGADNNGDGIGNSPYIIDENNQDNYPLIEPVE
jgi:parallel beta-helix repeat protein